MARSNACREFRTADVAADESPYPRDWSRLSKRRPSEDIYVHADVLRKHDFLREGTKKLAVIAPFKWPSGAGENRSGIPLVEWQAGADLPSSLEMPIQVQPIENSEEMEFNRLVEEWKREVRSKSLMVTIAMHPAYQQMVGMGEKALPFIFERIKRADEKTYQWFWALAAITRQNPIPIELRGKVREMARVWLKWGQEHGYVGLD